jgi:regulatory protein
MAESPLDKAMNLLAVRARTELELDRALQKANVSTQDRKAVLARLRELGYMDDRETARTRARTRIERGDAPRLAARRLLAQGVGQEDASAAVAEAAGGADEVELAARALRRRLRGRAPRDEAEKRRLLRSLIAKGHRPRAAARALGMEWEGDDPTDD